ncbi:DNA repair protein rad51d, variant 2 [Entomophthora muscae]|uniref:DNA repair protein rad51d, variant 2 n=1 Tax=Entomophthora muscae TaxID=34485 RepID=A0ACC2TX42_9FUNG|nr:DNA repair protein rad51d, variant 2 [Entomophthora muscae]
MVEIKRIAKALEALKKPTISPSEDESGIHIATNFQKRDFIGCAEHLEKLGIIKDYQIVELLSPRPQHPARLTEKLHPHITIPGLGEFNKYKELHDIYDYIIKTTFSETSILKEAIQGDHLLEISDSSTKVPTDLLNVSKKGLGVWYLENCHPSPGSITELSGRSSSGKTQMCLAIVAFYLVAHRMEHTSGVNSPWNNPVLYIDSGGDFSSHALNFHLKGISSQMQNSSFDESCLSLISLFRCTDFESFLNTLSQIEQHNSSKGKSQISHVKLIVVDSISLLLAPFLQPQSNSKLTGTYPGQLLTTEAIQALRRLGLVLSCPILVCLIF